MLKNIVLIIKGLIIGFGKIMPGISGSILAISLNVYEPAIEAISNLFSNFKKNITYLGYLGLGIIISIVIFSKIITYFLNHYYFVTFSFIIGLIVGTIPNLFKNNKISNKKDFLFVLLPIFIIIFNFLKIEYILKPNLIFYFLIGFIEALTTIIPGISSTAIYMSFGIYDQFLDIFINIFTMKFLIFSLGLFLGIIITSKLVNFLYKSYRKETNLVVISLLICSIIILIKNIIKLPNFNIFIFLLFLILGFVISKTLDK